MYSLIVFIDSIYYTWAIYDRSEKYKRPNSAIKNASSREKSKP